MSWSGGMLGAWEPRATDKQLDTKLISLNLQLKRANDSLGSKVNGWAVERKKELEAQIKRIENEKASRVSEGAKF